MADPLDVEVLAAGHYLPDRDHAVDVGVIPPKHPRFLEPPDTFSHRARGDVQISIGEPVCFYWVTNRILAD